MRGFAPLLMGALCIAAPSFAALSGFYDSGEKITAILTSAEVADALHQAPVGAVSNIGTDADGADLWLIRTQGCDLTVALTALPPPEGMVGKTGYALRIKAPCP